jgi:type II secretory pathway pseudopilin PulG
MKYTSTHNLSPRAFTHIDAMIITCIAAAVLVILFALLVPALSRSRTPSNQSMNSAYMRGIHQSMVIFAQSNNGHLPGLNASCEVLPSHASEFASAPGNTLTGASMAARYYILLNGSLIPGNLLINPHDVLSKWNSSTAFPTIHQFSYTALRIGISPHSTDIGPHTARAAEWRDNANSQAILLTDRNTAPTAHSNTVRSVWASSSSPGADWRGTTLWGDNHAEFLQAPNARLGPLSLSTKYGSTINSNDFLFSSDAMPGKSATASAMFGYTSANF